MNNILFENIEFGRDVYIHPSAKLQGCKGKGKTLKIGDNTYIGERVQIMVDEFEIGDYVKLHHDINIHGYKPCIIGHNFWCGQFTIIDSIGGVTIGNNVGIGAHSQLWSHIKFGDTLAGCQWNSEKPLIIEDDVWFVGHCIVSPITAHARSMALVGSVVTKDMEENKVYAGVPAKEMDGLVQFKSNGSAFDKRIEMQRYLRDSGVDMSKIRISNVYDCNDEYDESITYFFIEDRKYTKRGTPDEVAFMKYLLPQRAKFIPL